MLGAAQAIADAARLLQMGELAGPPAHGPWRCWPIRPQLESGTLALAPAGFVLDSMLQEFSDALSARAGAGTDAQGGELIIEVEPDVPSVLQGDAPRLVHLLLTEAELLWGAGDGDLSVRVGLDEPRVGLPAPAPGEHLCLRFEISADHPEPQGAAPRGFGPGRVHPRAADRADGRAGGHQGRRGAGRVAWFTSLLALPDAPPEDELDAGPAATLQGRRVLVVDDNERVRTMLVRLLGHWGLAAVAAKSGNAAVEAAAAAENAGPAFELMLLDADMPELDGLETVRLLDTRGLRSPPQVVLMSPLPAGPMLARAQQAGVAEVLGKPLGRRALRQTLEQMFPRAGGAAGPRCRAAGAARSGACRKPCWPWAGRGCCSSRTTRSTSKSPSNCCRPRAWKCSWPSTARLRWTC